MNKLNKNLSLKVEKIENTIYLKLKRLHIFLMSLSEIMNKIEDG